MKLLTLLTDIRLGLALGGGAGLAPKAPGTAGSLLALPLYYLAAWGLPAAGVWILALVMLAAGPAICAHGERALNSADDGRIVWDEIAAFFVVLVVLPAAWPWQLAAFIIFRLLDTLKPFPISWVDKKVKGGWGIMLDDLLAAAVTIAIVSAGMVL